jgi:hypothetical protein
VRQSGTVAKFGVFGLGEVRSRNVQRKLPRLGGLWRYGRAVDSGARSPMNATLSVEDIFGFLQDWFAQVPWAYLNGNGEVTFRDIFECLEC